MKPIKYQWGFLCIALSIPMGMLIGAILDPPFDFACSAVFGLYLGILGVKLTTR